MSRGVPLADRAPLSSLSSLLAAHGVPMRTIEEAIARQVVHGSDLPTNLLELGGVSEGLLLQVLADASNLEPAALGSLAPPQPAALKFVSADMASQLNIIPLSLEGSVMKLAVAEPFASTADLGFGSTISVVQIIAPLPRIRQAISTTYRMPLDKRMTRLLAKLGEPSATGTRFEVQDEPTQVSGIPLVDLGIVRPSTQTPATLMARGNPEGGVPPAKPTQIQAAPKPPPHNEHDAPTTAPPGGVAKALADSPMPQTVPGDVALAKGNAPAWATRTPIVQVVEPPAGWRPPITSDDMPETIPAPRLAAMNKQQENKGKSDEEGAPVSRRTAGLTKLRETARNRAAGGLFRRTVVSEHKAREQARQAIVEPLPQERRGSVRVRRKGPFTAQMAEEELAEATATDLVLDTLFSFAQQFFEYTVLFVVSGEMADGRDASGPGLTATQIKNIKFPLDQPSFLQLARDRKAPVTAPPISHGVDVQIIRDLAREARYVDGHRAAVAVLPVVVRNRVVALLFGDDGNVDVDLSALGDVIIILGRTVEALERVILLKKLGAAGRSPSVMPPANPSSIPPPDHIEGLRPVGLAALARAFDTTSGVESEPEATSLPPTKSAPTATLLSPAAMRSTESPGFTVRHEQPDVLPRSSRQAARSGGTNRGGSSSSSGGETPPDEDGPEPAATSEKSTGPASRRRRFLNGPNSRPRLAPAPATDAGQASSLDLPQATIPGMPRSQRRGVMPNLGPRGRIGPRPLPPNIGLSSKAQVRVPPGRTIAAESVTPSTLGGPPLPPTVQTRQTVGSSDEKTVEINIEQLLRRSEREILALLQRFIDSNGADNDAGHVIVKMGERAVPAIMTLFPGPLAPGVDHESTNIPPASSCGPVLALLAAIGEDALLPIAQRATSVLSDDRFWAAHLLGEIECVESAEVVGTLLFDDDLSVRRMARRATTNLLANVEGAEDAVLPMLEQAARGSSERPGRRFLALETLGELAVPSTVPALIAMLADPVADVAEAVRRSLVQITCQDFARDARRWIDWFAANASRHRIEWLMDALMHDAAELRRIASDALAPLVGRDLGYDPYESREERSAAHVRYLLWWEQDGHAKFVE